MIHGIVVDDELSALKWFRRVASDIPLLSIEGEFESTNDAISYVQEHRIDVAFLDIDMPDMDGLDLAERLIKIDPRIQVVFITAYNHFALQAFRTHAVGYLVKPLERNELFEQIRMIAARIGTANEGGVMAENSAP